MGTLRRGDDSADLASFAADLEEFAETLSVNEKVILWALIGMLASPMERWRAVPVSDYLSPVETELLARLQSEA